MQQDSAVSIPVSASTHFRAIGDTGSSSLNLYASQRGESTGHGGDKDPEESKTAKPGDVAGREQGIIVEDNSAFNVQPFSVKHSRSFFFHQ